MREFVVNAEQGGGERKELCNDEEDVTSDVVVFTNRETGEGQNHRDGKGSRRDGFFEDAW